MIVECAEKAKEKEPQRDWKTGDWGGQLFSITLLFDLDLTLALVRLSHPQPVGPTQGIEVHPAIKP